MRAAIIGAAGMLGDKLARAVAASAHWRDLDLVDIVAPRLSGAGVAHLVGDVSVPEMAERIVARRPQVIFHVAATFMGQADSDFAAGYRINVETVRALLEAVRRAGDDYRPRFVHASSIGVFGPPFPPLIEDDHRPVPDSSYGAQKLICETILSDYSRRGFVNAVSLRLPTIAIRPGAPTHGNSGFFSNIIREPLAGRMAILPAARTVRHWLASPRSAVAYLIHAARMDTAPLGGDRALTMPGLTVSVDDQIEALRRVAGEPAVALIETAPDPLWGPEAYPAAFAAARAQALGFASLEHDFAGILAAYLEDDAAGDGVR